MLALEAWEFRPLIKNVSLPIRDDSHLVARALGHSEGQEVKFYNETEVQLLKSQVNLGNLGHPIPFYKVLRKPLIL